MELFPIIYTTFVSVNLTLFAVLTVLDYFLKTDHIKIQSLQAFITFFVMMFTPILNIFFIILVTYYYYNLKE